MKNQVFSVENMDDIRGKVYRAVTQGRRGGSANLCGLLRIGTENTDKRAIPAQIRDYAKMMLLSSRVISPVPALYPVCPIYPVYP